MMNSFELQADGSYLILKDPDDVLEYGIFWYEWLRGSDQYWEPNRFVRPGEVFTPSKRYLNAHRYVATIGGTTAVTEPEWPVIEGANIVDGGVTWHEIGPEDKVATSEWDAGGLTATDPQIDSTGYLVAVMLAGLTTSERHTVKNSIVSVRGRHKDQSFTVIVRQN